MGSDVHVVVVDGADGLVERAHRRIDELECRWSRFRPESEVSRLTALAGATVVVSDDTARLVARAMEAWRLTGGAFDPTVLGDVVRAGYDRSFERLGRRATAGASPLGRGCPDIELDGNAVRLPAGTGFDPGGIGKGLAADMVVRELLDAGVAGICVNVGGDLRVGGEGPGGGAWTIAIEHPLRAEPLVRVGLHAGAVATSTTLRRRWRVDGEARHHLIDPDTGRPSRTDLTLAAVVARDAWVAEVLAKAVLLRGSEHPFDLSDGTGAEAVVVDHAGRVAASEHFDRYLGDAHLPPIIETSARVRALLARAAS
jgi:thiamine biosynthesis lipoprotein